MTSGEVRWDGAAFRPVGSAGTGLVGKIVAGIVIAFAIIAFVLWGVVEAVTANDGAQCSIESAERVQQGQAPLSCP